MPSRRARLTPFAFMLVAVVSGCPGPEPAPQEIDDLARFFLVRFDPGETDVAISDAELQDGMDKIAAALGALDEPQKNLLAPLTQAELDGVGLSDHDPDKPQGMFIANKLACTLSQLDEIVSNPDQLALYPEAYASYARELDEGTPPFLSTWITTYTSSDNALISNQYTASVRSGVRRVPDGGAGAGVVLRAILPEPAVFEADGSEFTDDFQVETFQERAPGELVHFYGMWRFMQLGVLGNSYDGVFIDQTMQGMLDWDAKTEALCAGE